MTRQVLMLALGLSLLAEAASFTCMGLAASDTLYFRILFGFHRPGVEAAGLLVPELHEDDPNVSTFELVMVWVVFITAALIQWFFISLAGVAAYRHFLGRRYENVFAA